MEAMLILAFVTLGVAGAFAFLSLTNSGSAGSSITAGLQCSFTVSNGTYVYIGTNSSLPVWVLIYNANGFVGAYGPYNNSLIVINVNASKVVVESTKGEVGTCIYHPSVGGVWVVRAFRGFRRRRVQGRDRVAEVARSEYLRADAW